MSVSRIFTIVGDGNVRRNMTALNIASRTSMKSAQVIDHVGIPLEQALLGVQPESNVCIIASITDMLISGGDCGTIFSTIDPVLASLHAQITSFCISRPSIQVLGFINLCSYSLLVLVLVTKKKLSFKTSLRSLLLRRQAFCRVTLCRSLHSEH